MPVPSPYGLILGPLNTSGLAYAVTGSVACIVYGEPRLTADIDIVVLLRRADIPRVEAAFPITDYYCPPTETLLIEVDRTHRGLFNVIHQKTGFKADFFVAARDPLHVWALEHRRVKKVQGDDVWLAPPEYVVVRKLEAFREGGSEKHLRDIRFIRAATELNERFLTVQIDRLGLEEQWALCRTRSD